MRWWDDGSRPFSDFMVKVAFVQREGYEKIGVHYLAGACRAAGIDYQLFIYDLEKDFWTELVKYDPSYVAYSLFIGEEKWSFACLKRVKELLPRAKTLVGGSFTLLFPEICRRQGVDFVFRGDGEYTLPAFIRKMETGDSVENIHGICYVGGDGREYRNDSLKLVDTKGLPSPDRDLYYKYMPLKNQSRKSFIASRGCPYRCTYCYNGELASFFQTKYWRQREAQEVLKEIAYVRDTYGLQWVHFQDGTFNADKTWLCSFLQQYREARLPPFICNARVENVDENLVRLLKEAGCNRITFGIQSGNPRIRREVAGRAMANKEIIEASSLCSKHGIRVGIDIMFGWPGESLQEAMDTIRLCRQIDAETYSSNVLVFYPGLRITDFAHRKGYIEKVPTLDEIHNLNLNKSLLLDKKKKLFINLDKLFYYLIRYPRFERVLLVLIRLPPNRLFLLMKNIHFLFRSFKYDQEHTKTQLVLRYLKNSWNADKKAGGECRMS